MYFFLCTYSYSIILMYLFYSILSDLSNKIYIIFFSLLIFIFVKINNFLYILFNVWYVVSLLFVGVLCFKCWGFLVIFQDLNQ